MAVPAGSTVAVSAADVITVPAVPVAAASAVAATDYDSVDQAIAAAAHDGGAPMGLSRLNLVGQVATMHPNWLWDSSNLTCVRCLIRG